MPGPARSVGKNIPAQNGEGTLDKESRLRSTTTGDGATAVTRACRWPMPGLLLALHGSNHLAEGPVRDRGTAELVRQSRSGDRGLYGRSMSAPNEVANKYGPGQGPWTPSTRRGPGGR